MDTRLAGASKVSTVEFAEVAEAPGRIQWLYQGSHAANVMLVGLAEIHGHDASLTDAAKQRLHDIALCFLFICCCHLWAVTTRPEVGQARFQQA